MAAGEAKVDNPKYKARFGTEAKMLTPQKEELVGHVVGGVYPFTVNEGARVYLDKSLKRFETVFPAGGSSNSAIELPIPELERYFRLRKLGGRVQGLEVGVKKRRGRVPAPFLIVQSNLIGG